MISFEEFLRQKAVELDESFNNNVAEMMDRGLQVLLGPRYEEFKNLKYNRDALQSYNGIIKQLNMIQPAMGTTKQEHNPQLKAFAQKILHFLDTYQGIIDKMQKSDGMNWRD